jgi:subtilisin-like proprotein convertase family protein
LTAGITYYYKITAISQDDSCASGESNCASVTVETCRSDLQFSRPVCSCASTGSITLVDPDYNAAGGVDVFVHSTTYPAEVMIHLARITSTSPYRYRGTFATTPGTPGAGEVQAAHGDQLTARYYDADGCGMPRQVYADAAVECQAPAIAGVEVLNITATGAEVHWFTSEPADSKVTYGAAVPPGTSQSDASPVIEHSIALSALQPCTVYFLSVTSKDAAGNSHTDDNSGAYYSFTTLSEDQTSYARTESPSLPVTDNEPDGVASTLAVPVRRSILDVDVTVTLTHPYVGDLELHLRGPDGTRVPLVRRCGGGGNDFTATVFDDEASTGICAGTAPFTGFFIPDTSLAAFDGKEAYGTWTLEAADWKARDEGAILSWALAFTFPPGCTPNLDVQSAAFTDACYETGSGGGDGVLDPGEDAVLTLTLANTGNQAATAATTAMLDSGTAGVFVFDRSGSFPPLAAGASGTNAGNTFAVRVDDSVACGAPASFTLSSSSPPANQTFTVPVGQTATPAITVLNQPFATAGLPSGWAVEKISGNNWAVDGTGSCSASFALNHPSHTTTDADVWVFTSPIRLFPGRTYTLQFTQRVEADNLPQDLSVWAGLAQDHAAMTLPVWSRTGVTNMDCRTRTASFTVPASDYYHIGFHCTTPAARGLLTVDDILLTFPGNPVCTMNPCSAPPAPGEVAPGTSFAAALIWTDPQTLAWPAEALSTVYRVYRGAPEDLPKTLAGVETNTCIGYEGPATFATAAGTPPPGGFHWYVVTGRNANGEGPAGHDRVVSSWGACP